MFDIDNWTEIFSSIKKNKVRTFLTGFAIAWGIFMFVIMLAASNGAQTGIQSVFAKRTSNILQVQGRFTSIPYEGLPENRSINLDNRDLNRLRNRFVETEYISAMIPVRTRIRYGSESTVGNTIGIYPDYNNVGGIKIVDNQGRLIHNRDMDEQRKVVIVNRRLREVLFNDEDPVGRTMLINDLPFTVIGVFSENAIVDLEKAYIPFSTAQLLFGDGWRFNNLAFTVQGLRTNRDNETFSAHLRRDFAAAHQFHPNDRVAVNMQNELRTYLQTFGIFNAIVIFIWVIGIGTLFAGMVGVSNIMLITVRERTKEFGIRKALGAKPSSIIKGIILESVTITSMFGYLGLFLGIWVCGLANIWLKNHPDVEKFAIFENPSVDMGMAIAAMVLLIVVGVLAGYFPARQAVRVPPVEAMRAE
ncbi:MAG: ABC transporter permease [Dysgonamonadaceae bacterium]|jgi:putative ABC transport system permease protein|nr:ABC transporter permease [Dysgonamonadaceae bacterium]